MAILRKLGPKLGVTYPIRHLYLKIKKIIILDEFYQRSRTEIRGNPYIISSHLCELWNLPTVNCNISAVR